MLIKAAIGLFMTITIGMVLAAIPMAVFTNNPAWLWMLIPIVLYLS
jgi:hypothetical protein